jgi:hypothetical protein
VRKDLRRLTKIPESWRLGSAGSKDSAFKRLPHMNVMFGPKLIRFRSRLNSSSVSCRMVSPSPSSARKKERAGVSVQSKKLAACPRSCGSIGAHSLGPRNTLQIRWTIIFAHRGHKKVEKLLAGSSRKASVVGLIEEVAGVRQGNEQRGSTVGASNWPFHASFECAQTAQSQKRAQSQNERQTGGA